MHLRKLLLTLTTALVAGCATHHNAPEQVTELPDYTHRVIEDQVYTPADWPEPLRADIYLPETRKAQRLPAVLLVHGGGWEGGSPDDVAHIATKLSRNGFVVFNVNYRLAPAYRFPAPLQDLQQAMRWIHTHAARFSVDPQRIGAFGYSAGAHLVSLLGVVAGSGHALDTPFGGPQTRPAGVVAGGTPSDLRKFPGGRLVPQFLGDTLQENPGLFAAASPAWHVSSGSPPHFLYHGTLDYLVPVDHATDLAARLAEHGVAVETYLMHGRGHITAFVTARRAVRAAADFLHRHLGTGTHDLSSARISE